MALLSLSQHAAVIKCFSLHFITALKIHFVVQSQRFPTRKDSRGFCKRTNNVHKFKGCFLRRRGKKNENLLFSESTANVSSSRQPVLPDRLMFINFSKEMEDCYLLTGQYLTLNEEVISRDSLAWLTRTLCE